MNIDKVIELFNNGNWDRVEPIFNNIQSFLKYVKSKNKLNLIDHRSMYDALPGYEFNEASIILLKEYGPDYFLDYFDEINKIGDEYYIEIDALSEFSVLFDDGYSRGMTDSEIVKEILGEDFFEMFSDTVSSYHSDIVSDLNEENMLELKNIILHDLENSELDSDNFSGLFFQNNTDENGNVQINNENINYVLSDRKTFDELIKSGYLTRLKGNLRSLHNIAYNEAWNDEVFKQIKTHLNNYVDTDFKWENKDMGRGRTKSYIKCKIKNLKVDIFNFLECMKEYDDEQLINQGSYLEMLSTEMNHCIGHFDLNLPEYSDNSLVKEYLNDSFLDYME
jgi:hypothetical protein